jgi:hypothetical protein
MSGMVGRSSSANSVWIAGSSLSWALRQSVVHTARTATRIAAASWKREAGCYRDATLLGFRDSLTMPITPPSRPAPRA